MSAYELASIISALLTGTILGLIVYFFSTKEKNKNQLGIIGCVSTILAHFLLGLLLSIPTMIVFMIMIKVSLIGTNYKEKNKPLN